MHTVLAQIMQYRLGGWCVFEFLTDLIEIMNFSVKSANVSILISLGAGNYDDKPTKIKDNYKNCILHHKKQADYCQNGRKWGHNPQGMLPVSPTSIMRIYCDFHCLFASRIIKFFINKESRCHEWCGV